MHAQTYTHMHYNTHITHATAWCRLQFMNREDINRAVTAGQWSIWKEMDFYDFRRYKSSGFYLWMSCVISLFHFFVVGQWTDGQLDIGLWTETDSRESPHALPLERWGRPQLYPEAPRSPHWHWTWRQVSGLSGAEGGCQKWGRRKMRSSSVTQFRDNGFCISCEDHVSIRHSSPRMTCSKA